MEHHPAAGDVERRAADLVGDVAGHDHGDVDVGLNGVAIIAQTITFVVLVTAAIWYAAPWMKRHSLATALTVPSGFTHYARSPCRSSRHASSVSTSRSTWPARSPGAMSSARPSGFTCLWLLRYRSRWAGLVLWILVIETVIDLVNATIQGIRNDVFTTANGVTWVILNFYVPLLWVTLALILWRLTSPEAVQQSPIRGARISTDSAI